MSASSDSSTDSSTVTPCPTRGTAHPRRCSRPHLSVELSVNAPSQALLRSRAHRSGLPRQFKALPGVGQLVAIHLQDRHVPIYEVADIEMAPVRAERAALRKRTH